MPKIAIIGAGGVVFPLRLIGDLLNFPDLRGSTLSLMDIDVGAAERTGAAARELVRHHGFSTAIETTDDSRAALNGADVVIVTFQVGGIDAYRHDVEIPRRYGLDQPVGDSLGPGGVMRFLRSAPAYAAIAADMHELCPNALLINYANPMAMNCWLLDRLGVRHVGLCHSVQGTSRMLARHLEVPYEEISYLAGGINHQAWFLRFRRGNEDLYPRLREVMIRTHIGAANAHDLVADSGDHSVPDRGDSDYEGGAERVRTEIMAMFGFFHTESSHHASEYLPYFRKDAATIDHFITRRWDYFQICSNHDPAGQTDRLLAALKEELAPSVEYGATIVHAMTTNRPAVVYGNIPNRGLISNLPDGCCVEVPCLVDANGVQGTAIGALPPQLAAVNRTNINVQELAVAAVLEESVDHIHHAIALDPLSGALLRLDQIRAMTNELLVAERQWLPPFAR